MRRWLLLACLLWWIPGLWAADESPERFMISLEVDFGPIDRPIINAEFEVPRGATSEDALKGVCPIQKGATCCDPREVSGIDGVEVNPARNRWWTVAINGSRKVSPYETELQPDDHVLWRYVENTQ